MLTAASRARIDSFWAELLGCAPAVLGRPGVHMAVHGAPLGNYRGLHLWQRDDTCIVSAPGDLVHHVAARAQQHTATTLFDPAVAGQLVSAHDLVLGPALVSYTDGGDPDPAVSADVRTLDAGDRAALMVFAAACGPEAWEHGGIDPDRSPIFARFVGEQIVAACSWEEWGAEILHVGVVTHRAYCGRGHGRAVAEAATVSGLVDRKIMQWRTLESNAASLALGRSLGYQPYARTIAVRL